MKTTFLLYFLSIALYTQGQSLEQYTIGSAGSFSATTGGATLSSSIGELIVSTENSSSAILTQGFQQPLVVTPLSTNSPAHQSFDLIVFPNPTAQYLTIQTAEDQVLKAELINILGQAIESYSLTASKTIINLGQLPVANYLLRVSNIENTTVQTFKIQKTQ